MAKTSKKAKEAREKITLLHFLCEKSNIDINEELAMLLPLISDKIRKSESYTATNCETLAWYRISEPIPYKRIAHDGDSFNTFYDLTAKEIEAIEKETYFVEAGHSLLGDIEALLDDLSAFAAPKDRKAFTEAKLSIGAKASEEVMRVIPSNSTSENTTDQPDKEAITMKKDKKSKAIAASNAANETCTNATAASNNANPDPYTEAIELSGQKKLPAFFDQDIKSKHIAAGIYCHCRIKLGGKRKVSKKAIFIDCTVK